MRSPDRSRVDWSRLAPWWRRGGLAVVLSAFAAAAAAQTEVRNDSIEDFGQVAIQAGFVAGERGAAWLTAPCSGEMTAVRILWLASTGGGGQTLGEQVTVSEAGTFPAAGDPLLELVGPVLTEGFFNEFVVSPPLPWALDETLVVDFQFLDSPPPLGPSLVTDIDGCQAGKNAVFAIPPAAWLDLCPFGVAGDLAIRAVTSCGDDVIFVDGFESGDTSAWSSSQGSPPSAYPVLRVDPERPPFWRRPRREPGADRRR